MLLLLLSSGTATAKPKVDVLTTQTQTAAAESLADIDAALKRARKDSDRSVLLALRAQALASAAREPTFEARHPGWITEVSDAVVESKSLDPEGVHTAHRELAIQRVREELVVRVNEAPPGSVPYRLDANMLTESLAMAVLLDDPWIYATVGLASAIRFELTRALGAYQGCATAVGRQPASARNAEVASVAASFLAREALYGRLDRDALSVLYKTLDADREHLEETGETAKLEQMLVLAVLSVDWLASEAHRDKRGRAYLERYPDDGGTWLAWGTFLHSLGKDEAESALARAVELEPDNMRGRAQLAGFYVGLAMAMEQSAFGAPEDEVARAKEAARELNLQAFPHLEAAHKLSPEDFSVLMALIQVCASLEDEVAYATYKAKLDALRQ